MQRATSYRELVCPALISCLGLLVSGCGEDTPEASLRALDVSGEVSTLCLARDPGGAYTLGVDLSQCPDFFYNSSNPNQKRLHALVTQPINGEVALVDLSVNPILAVSDYEPSQPGYSFMPVGAEPGAIVSTRGGVASFVSVREAGREGIFGLPSSCIAPRSEGAPLRDIRTWPACRLPAAPGPMIMLQDPLVDDDANPATPPSMRATCGGEYVDPELLIGVAPAATRAECPADLATETRTGGRQKLAVALPSLSEIWIVDAQELLDRPPGSFDACTFEHRLTLSAVMPTSPQQLPVELVPSSPACMPVGFEHGPVPEAFRPAPSDFALDDEGRLYVADSEAPAVHVLDASDPCELRALAPLEPLSYSDPGAVITTRRVAVSPLTPQGQRFVYAVDNSITRTAGSLIPFDVSPGSTNPTPIIRDRSIFNPTEAPDRVALIRDVADVEFVSQDFPQPENGIAVEGIACDPDPSLDSDDPGALYRPRSDSASGASPGTLRGTYAFAALHSGQVAIVDVEDLDAACRRPKELEHSATEDIAGCSNDDPSVPEYSVAGYPTVSDELSCHIVSPHRARSRNFFTNSSGRRSAGLLAFPTLTLDTGRSVATDQTDEGRDQPKMLAARHAVGVQDLLYVGPLAYETPSSANADSAYRLDVDPQRAERSSLVLSYEEPRAFFPDEDFTATYEGLVRSLAQALFSVDAESGLGVVDEGLNASFCAAGVQDLELTRSVGAELGVSAGKDQDVFARRHADYVHVTAELLESDDEYWLPGEPGAECGRELFESELGGHTLCEQFFGPPEVPSTWRDLRIMEAGQDRLLVEPRPFDPAKDSGTRRRQLTEFVSCCFPRLTDFEVRAGNQWVVRGSATGAPHRVAADPETGRCVSDCSPLIQKQRSRVFELSCSSNCTTDAEGRPAIGFADTDADDDATDNDFVCIVDETDFADGIDPGEKGSECVFESISTRFAIYRGQTTSRRDMRFRWQLSDGFSPLTIQLINSVDRPRSTPRLLQLIPETSQLVITDGSTRGILFLSARNPGRPAIPIF